MNKNGGHAVAPLQVQIDNLKSGQHNLLEANSRKQDKP